MTKTTTLYIVFCTLCLLQLKAQEVRQDTIKAFPYEWEFKINAGYNIGGTIPIPFPAEIREIQQFKPLAWSPHLALEGTYWFNQHWGVSIQLSIDRKGFKVTDSVYQLSTRMKDENIDISGSYTGINSNSVENLYFVAPVLASYRLSKQWIVQVGLYAAYLVSPQFISTAVDGYFRKEGPTGEKTHVLNSVMDFSNEQNNFDWGILAAGEWILYKNISLRGQFSYGFNPIFPSHFTAIAFEMHNVYGTIGIAYSFGKLK